MQLITILNRTVNFKSFVFKKCFFGTPRKATPTIEIEVVPRKGSKAICSKCRKKSPGYDSLPTRRFEHIPFWGFLVLFVYTPRRVNCTTCGVRVEWMPWANGKSHLTQSYSWFLAQWAMRLSWKEVAQHFKTTWYHVFTAVEMAVAWGRSQMNLDNISSIGIDEIQWQSGKRYLTLVYQIDNHCKRLLWIGKNRTKKTLEGFFNWLGIPRTQNIKFICSDIWLAYLNAVKKRAPQALHILDRFHIIAQIKKAIDKVRAEEVRKLKEKAQKPVLKRTRWIFLKNPENLTVKQDQKLAALLKQNLKTVKSYLLKEHFQRLWEYISPYWAGKFLDRWTRKVMYSKIEPMKKVARTIREHKPLILNWFKAKKKISQAVVEGMNNKVKLTIRKAYGFKTFKATEIQLFHVLGDLPQPHFTHKFF
jgi:transposase